MTSYHDEAMRQNPTPPAPAFFIASGTVGGERITAVKTRRIVGGDLVYAETGAGLFTLGVLRYRRKSLIHNGRKPR